MKTKAGAKEHQDLGFWSKLYARLFFGLHDMYVLSGCIWD